MAVGTSTELVKLHRQNIVCVTILGILPFLQLLRKTKTTCMLTVIFIDEKSMPALRASKSLANNVVLYSVYCTLVTKISLNVIHLKSVSSHQFRQELFLFHERTVDWYHFCKIFFKRLPFMHLIFGGSTSLKSTRNHN